VSLVAVIKPKAKEKISPCRHVFILNPKTNVFFKVAYFHKDLLPHKKCAIKVSGGAIGIST